MKDDISCPVFGFRAFELCAVEKIRVLPNGQEIYRCRNNTKQKNGQKCRFTRGLALHTNGYANESRKADNFKLGRTQNISVQADTFTD